MWIPTLTVLSLGCVSPPPVAQPGLPHPQIAPHPEHMTGAASGDEARRREESSPDEELPPAYELDRMSRKVPISGSARCPAIDLVEYSGTEVRFHKPLRIAEPFRAHVRAFEAIVRDAAIEVYGRPPTRIRHFGSFYCRRISTWPYLISEHGMGNALDVGGFDFSRLKKGQYPDVQKRFRRSFQVRVSRHWHASGKDAAHARFLRLVARRAIDRAGLFRVILGPAHPGHKDHFHFDMAQHRVVNVF